MGNTRKELEESWQADLAAAKALLFEVGSVQPVFFVRSREGATVPVQGFWRDNGDKAVVRNIVRLLCVAMDAASIGWVGEAWVVVAPGTLDVAPSKSHRRREVVVASFEARPDDCPEGLRRFEMREIVRDGDGRPSGTAPLDIPEGAQGRSFDMETDDLLPPHRPTRVQRVVAWTALKRLGMELPMELLGEAGEPPFPSMEEVEEGLARIGLALPPCAGGGPTLH